jgi:hypothetical protein
MSAARIRIAVWLPLLLGAAGAWLYWRQSTINASLRADLVALQGRMAASRKVEDRLFAPGMFALSAAAGGAALVPVPPSTLPVTAAGGNTFLVTETREEKNRRVADTLDAVFVGESMDRSWDFRVAAQARDELAKLRGSQLVSAECRTSLCKVVVASESIRDQRDLGEAIAGKAPFDQDVWYHYDRNSHPPVTTLYVLHEGVSVSALIGTSAD